MEKITSKDIQDAIKSLTTGKYVGGCWYKRLATTDDGTVLCFVIGWSDAGYDQEDIDKNGYGCPEKGVCLCAKIAYQHSNNMMQCDYAWDWNMPYDKESGEVWDTDMMVPNGGFDDFDVQWYNKEAKDIWDTYGENGGLDQLESKKHESRHRFANRKKSEGYGPDISISAADLRIELSDVSDHDSFGRSFTLSVHPGERYAMDEFKQMVQDMCEDSAGYADISRDGSEVLVQVFTPDDDESGEYSCAREIRGVVGIISTSIENVVDYLNDESK